MLFLTALLAVAAIGLLWLVLSYRRLAAMHRSAARAFRQIEAQMDRRHELVPELLDLVRQYIRHEHEALNRLERARYVARQVVHLHLRSHAEAKLSLAVNAVILSASDHPALGSDPKLAEFHRELDAIEKKIAFARGFYNEVAEAYNAHLATPIGRLLAIFGRFRPYSLFAHEPLGAPGLLAAS